MNKSGSLNLSKTQKDSKSIAITTISKRLSGSGELCQTDDSKEPVWKWRYVITIIAFLITMLSTFNRIAMTIVLVAMVNNTAVSQNLKSKSQSCQDLIMNSTEDPLLRSNKQEGEFNWSPEIQGYILGCLFFGPLISQIPAARFSERFGCKRMLMMSLLISGILTILMPPFSRLGASAMVVLQVLRGIALGIPGTCVSILIANWSPKTERGFLYSIVQSAYCLGPALGNIFAGYVSETIGWPYVFYLLGGVTLILTLCTLLLISESPKEHSSISKAELNFILSQQERSLSKKRPKLPWRQMLTSVPFYALLLVMIGRYWTFSQFNLAHSLFLGTVLHYSLGENGSLSAVPFFIAFIFSTISTWISGYIEKKELVSVDFLRKFWVFISSSLFSLCLFGMYMAGCNRKLSVTCAILSMGFAGLGTPGCTVVLQDMSPTFAGTLYSISNSVAYTSSIIFPVIVGYLTDEKQTLEQWNKVFFISIGVVMFTAIAFIFLGSAKIQPWDSVQEEKRVEDEKKLENVKNNELTRL